MKLKVFISKFSNLKSENILMRFIIILIGGVVVFNSFMIHQALNRQTVVLIPPGLTSKVEISNGKFSEEYVRTFARHATDLALTYAPVNVRSRFDDLLLLFDSESYKEAYKSFYDLAGIVEEKNVSSVFYMNQPIYVDTKEKTITVEGLIRRYKDNAKLEETDRKYVIKYKIDDSQSAPGGGQFKIVNFSEKENRQSHDK